MGMSNTGIYIDVKGEGWKAFTDLRSALRACRKYSLAITEYLIAAEFAGWTDIEWSLFRSLLEEIQSRDVRGKLPNYADVFWYWQEGLPHPLGQRFIGKDLLRMDSQYPVRQINLTIRSRGDLGNRFADVILRTAKVK